MVCAIRQCPVPFFWKKISGKFENAYFTVEASLIMPLVIGVILFIVMIGCYQYDRCLLAQDSYRMLLRAEQCSFADNQEIVQSMEAQAAQWYYDKYLFCRIHAQTAQVTHGSIQITSTGRFQAGISFPGVSRDAEGWKLSQESRVHRIRPERAIRLCRKLAALSEKNQKEE